MEPARRGRVPRCEPCARTALRPGCGRGPPRGARAFPCGAPPHLLALNPPTRPADPPPREGAVHACSGGPRLRARAGVRGSAPRRARQRSGLRERPAGAEGRGGAGAFWLRRPAAPGRRAGGLRVARVLGGVRERGRRRRGRAGPRGPPHGARPARLHARPRGDRPRARPRGHERDLRAAHRLRAGRRLRALARARRDGARVAARGRRARAPRFGSERSAGGGVRGARRIRGGRRRRALRAPRARAGRGGDPRLASAAAAERRPARGAGGRPGPGARPRDRRGPRGAARAVSAALLGVLLLVARGAAADDARLQALEERVNYLEDELARTRAEWRAAEPDGDADWTDRISLSGSAELGHFGGGSDSVWHDAGYRIWDARLFLDAELDEDIRFGSRQLVRNLGFTAEWNLVRLGDVVNDVGELYVDLQGILGSSWLNLRPGRFQAPVGEAYSRYGRDAARDPFISHPVGGPWWWDEGVLAYGGSREGELGYVASVSNGETAFGFDQGSGEQVTLKLWTQPLPWLYLSASALHSGEIDGSGGALWLGESW